MTKVNEIHLIGLAASRPAASSSNDGYLWTSTDVNGGTTYRSNGSSWVQIAGGVTVAGGALTVEEVDGSPTDSAVTKIVFPNGTLGIAAHVATYTPSGGGGSISRGAYASRPAAGTAGRLYLATDSPLTSYDDGAAWQEYAAGMPLVAPISGDFAWVNQGGATIDTSKGGIYLSAPANAGDSLRIRSKAAPATPYTITAAVLPLLSTQGTSYCGLVWRDSAGGGVVTFYISVNSADGALRLNVTKWSSPTVVVANYVGLINPGVLPAPLVWLRIADDGANRSCSYSTDGQNFLAYHSVGRTDFLTANEVGFTVNASSSAVAAGMTVLSWRQA